MEVESKRNTKESILEAPKLIVIKSHHYPNRNTVLQPTPLSLIAHNPKKNPLPQKQNFYHFIIEEVGRIIH